MNEATPVFVDVDKVNEAAVLPYSLGLTADPTRTFERSYERSTSEAAPQTDEACTAPLPGASLPGALYLSQPRTFTRETTFGNLAQL